MTTPDRTAPDRDTLIHDWNLPDLHASGAIQFDDETLRDGLQSPSVKDPTLDQKIELVRLMDGLGIQTANVGLPGAGARAREHILELSRVMKGLKIRPNVACRTVITDIEPVVDMVQKSGVPIEVCAFIGSSPIRQYAEGWNIDQMVQLSRDAVLFATKNDLPVMFVTEDTTRANPEHVRALYTAAIEAGAKRICVCDTCGHATPNGVKRMKPCWAATRTSSPRCWTPSLRCRPRRTAETVATVTPSSSAATTSSQPSPITERTTCSKLVSRAKRALGVARLRCMNARMEALQ